MGLVMHACRRIGDWHLLHSTIRYASNSCTLCARQMAPVSVSSFPVWLALTVLGCGLKVPSESCVYGSPCSRACTKLLTCACSAPLLGGVGSNSCWACLRLLSKTQSMASGCRSSSRTTSVCSLAISVQLMSTPKCFSSSGCSRIALSSYATTLLKFCAAQLLGACYPGVRQQTAPPMLAKH